MATARISVRVTPRAKRVGLAGRREDGVWQVRVAAPPEDGRANAEVCATIASAIGVRARDVIVAVGHTSRDKVVEINGVEESLVTDRLTAALPRR